VKALKPWVKVSTSPVGKYDDTTRYPSRGWNAYDAVKQDVAGWLGEGIQDQIFPMMYFKGNNFYPFAVNWKEFSYGRIIAPGLAVYMLHPRERDWAQDVITREMSVLREMHLGHTFFRSKFLTDNTKGIYSFTKEFNATPALVPPMTWLNRRAPLQPRTLQVQRGMTTDRLSWSGVNNNSKDEYILYNVYASEEYPVDDQNPANMIAIRLRGNSVVVPHGGRNLHYAVTAIDRYGNESIPTENKSLKPHRQIDFRQLIMGKSRKKY
jgi:hypothetical protein